jgi:hypothetical protein
LLLAFGRFVSLLSMSVPFFLFYNNHLLCIWIYLVAIL